MPGQCLLQEVDQRRVNPTSGVEECSEVCWKYPSIIFQYTWACLPLVFQISKPWIFFWRRFQIYLELITRLFVPIHQLLFWTTWSWRLIFLPPDSPAVATPLLASPVRKILQLIRWSLPFLRPPHQNNHVLQTLLYSLYCGQSAT